MDVKQSAVLFLSFLLLQESYCRVCSPDNVDKLRKLKMISANVQQNDYFQCLPHINESTHQAST